MIWTPNGRQNARTLQFGLRLDSSYVSSSWRRNLKELERIVNAVLKAIASFDIQHFYQIRNIGILDLRSTFAVDPHHPRGTVVFHTPSLRKATASGSLLASRSAGQD